VDVIGHNDISSHEPIIGANPNIPQKVMDVRSSQDRPLFVGADGEEDNRSAIGRLPRGHMHRCFPLRSFVHIFGGTRSVASALSAVSRFAMSFRWIHQVPFRLRPRRSVALRIAVQRIDTDGTRWFDAVAESWEVAGRARYSASFLEIRSSSVLSNGGPISIAQDAARWSTFAP
jgi:hypothetical protein